jgi:CubicO group peptidase (beta-lactamase class C family)
MDRTKRFFRLYCALLAVMLLAVSLSACSTPASQEEPEEVAPGDWPVKAWRRSAPEEQGVDSAVLSDMLQSIRQGGHDIHSVMLIRNGYLVADAYDAPGGKNAQQEVYSCTKSVTSALLGIAMEERRIKGLNSTLGEILGGQISDADRAGITVRELVTMSAGFPGLETLRSYEIPEKQDALKFILELPAGEKGKFVYNNACPHLVSTLIQKATGKSVLDYAREKLFDKLGIDCREWPADRAGVNVGGSGLKLTPFEMSKLGYLYLKNGEWDGAQLVPQKWVEESTAQQIDTADMNDAENHGYGYFWWRNAFGGYSAHGAGGQYIFVVPELDLVAVFTSTLGDADFPVPYRLMEEYVVPACKSKEPLPQNPDAVKKLEEAIKTFA